MGLLKTQNGAIFYQVLGEATAPPLVLLHGLGRSTRYWLGFDRLLAQHFRVIKVDARGLGRSRAPAAWTHTTVDLAEDVVRVLDHLGILQAHVFGLSLGGMVALTLGLHHPARVRSIAVVNTSVGGLGQARLKPEAFLALCVGAVFKPWLHPMLLRVCISDEGSPALRRKISAAWRRVEAAEGVPYLTTMKQVITATRFRLRQELPRLTAPVLIVYGSADRFVSYQNSIALARLLPRAELCCVDGAGHELSLDRPEELEEVVRAFVLREEQTPAAH